MKIGIYLVDITIFAYWVSCELMQISLELQIGGIGVKSGKVHHCHVEEWGCYLLGPIVVDLTVFRIREIFGLGLLGEQVIDAKPHLLVVLCCNC